MKSVIKVKILRNRMTHQHVFVLNSYMYQIFGDIVIVCPVTFIFSLLLL